jgi:hypothetical protein
MKLAAVGVAAALLLAGCGSGASSSRVSPQPASVADRVWLDSVSGFIENLDESVLLSTSGGDNLASARVALHNESDLYGMLVAYTMFAGCQETLLNLGAPAPRLGDVRKTLASACRRLERASALFTRAIKHSDPRVLLAATRTTLAAAPLLSRARVELRSDR